MGSADVLYTEFFCGTSSSINIRTSKTDLFFCYVQHLEDTGGSRGRPIAPRIHNFCTTLRWVGQIHSRNCCKPGERILVPSEQEKAMTKGHISNPFGKSVTVFQLIQLQKWATNSIQTDRQISPILTPVLLILAEYVPTTCRNKKSHFLFDWQS